MGFTRSVQFFDNCCLNPLTRYLFYDPEIRQFSIPRQRSLDNVTIPIFVINLPRVKQRQKFMENQLKPIQENVEFVKAFDSQNDVFEISEVSPYFGKERLRISGLNDPECRLARSKCSPTSTSHERSKIALDLTYLRLFRRIVSDPKIDYAIIFEDDASITIPTENFMGEIKKKIEMLPNNWGLLLLHHHPANIYGIEIAPEIRALRSGVATTGFVITKKTAQKVLNVSIWAMRDFYIDLLL